MTIILPRVGFRDMFEAFVHNVNGLEKLHYLKTSLTREAAANVDMNSINYAIAWDQLSSLR